MFKYEDMFPLIFFPFPSDHRLSPCPSQKPLEQDQTPSSLQSITGGPSAQPDGEPSGDVLLMA